jgi:hypothetical protein
MNIREKAAWAAVAALSVVAATGWGAWSWEAAARRQDHADAEATIHLLGEKAARGMFLEAQRARDEATRGTEGQ